jgi:hypothetical protein
MPDKPSQASCNLCDQVNLYLVTFRAIEAVVNTADAQHSYESKQTVGNGQLGEASLIRSVI